MLYFEVILPLKLSFEPTYSYEGNDDLSLGTIVRVLLSGREYHGVVSKIHDSKYIPQVAVKPILEICNQFPCISTRQMEFWRQLSTYYLCPIGLVFKAAFPQNSIEVVSKDEQKVKKAKKALNAQDSQDVQNAQGQQISLSPLSPAQEKAIAEIRKSFASSSRPLLLKGVTASGKTHIYMELAREVLEKGGNVLYLASELAYSTQLHSRLEKAFGKEIVMTCNSHTTAARKKKTISRLHSGEPTLVLGSRSAIFLPLGNLQLIIVDGENDASYKNQQAPYYNARDAAVFLAIVHKANIILGTATPSLETLYNVQAGKYSQVCLDEKYFSGSHTDLEIINTDSEWEKRGMHGSYSRKLATHITQTLQKGKQAIVLRTWKNSKRATTTTQALTLEDETRQLWPEARIAWIDNNTAQGAQKKIMESFAAGEVDILLGSMILSKGFDFSNVTLVALLGADSLMGREDFRCDEQAFAAMIHLWGRCARHSENGLFVIQTRTSSHPIIKSLSDDATSINEVEKHLLAERHEFGYPPYSRIVDVRIQDSDSLRLDAMANLLQQDFVLSCPGLKLIGPYTPALMKNGAKNEKIIRIFISKDKTSTQSKLFLQKIVKDFESVRKYLNHVIIDVDPL